VRMFSGEYEMRNGIAEPKNWSSVRTERASVERSGLFRARKMANVREA
jgi:hypothetical protein